MNFIKILADNEVVDLFQQIERDMYPRLTMFRTEPYDEHRSYAWFISRHLPNDRQNVISTIKVKKLNFGGDPFYTWELDP